MTNLFIEKELKSWSTHRPTVSVTFYVNDRSFTLGQDNDEQYDRIVLDYEQAQRMYNFLREVLD